MSSNAARHKDRYLDSIMGNLNTAAMNRQLAAYENTPAKG
jgi:hypothetical protein